jgi:hypothetical protein
MQLMRRIALHQSVILTISYILFLAGCEIWGIRGLAASISSALLVGAWVICACANFVVKILYGINPNGTMYAFTAAGFVYWISLSIGVPNDAVRHSIQDYGWMAVIGVCLILWYIKPKILAPSVREYRF